MLQELCDSSMLGVPESGPRGWSWESVTSTLEPFALLFDLTVVARHFSCSFTGQTAGL